MQTTTTGTGLGTAADVGTTGGVRMRIIGRADVASSGPGPELMAADTLEGDRVVNLNGEDLGKITDIMLDVQRGRIAYAVMSVGGFLGIGDKLFAVPWSAMSLDIDRKCFVLDADKDRLESAPGFDKDHWPAMADSTWATSIHEYYGSRPYWEEY
ncbi:PRC-barrel domain-containing protein [Ralstonia soli]|uniref:PRC-barrel domain-containing protein n=1 Tax=Ralstonia soli TaxID=2953896 RepID=A0ABT1AF24_9RALS|nr:PRC-barrel domain-containing protein [Ralstonia soli]MCO5396968.1 PRC-barrel domain-containing protein [Ralstonia soli]